MKTLHLFGDSFTGGHKLDITFSPYLQWKEFRKGDLPPCWGELLSKKLNMKMVNHGVGGMSNVEIFQTICQHSDKIDKDDIVIINWTYPHRFRWVTWSNEEKRYRWTRLSSHPLDGSKISEQTRQDISLNKSLPLYIDEVYEYEKLIGEYAKSKKFKLFFWSADVDIINDLPSTRLNDRKYILHEQIDKLPLKIEGSSFINVVRSELKRTIFDVFYNFGAETIYEETNGEVNDNHLGEKGHFIQFELFYNYIMENNVV
jgi:hypothetical protein